MLINEVTSFYENESNPEEEVAAISQLLIDRSNDENTESKLNVNSFIKIANKMGIPMTVDTLMDLAQSGDLQNVIQDVNQNEIVFKGRQDVDINADMTVDHARDVVNNMAKRNMNKKGGLGSGPEDDELGDYAGGDDEK